MTLGNSLNTPKRSMALGTTLTLALLALLVTATSSFAQPAQQRARTLDEPFRLILDETTPTAKRALFDWGGWLRTSYWVIDENVDRDFNGSEDGSHAFYQQQLRLWGNLNFDQAHHFYARMRLDCYDWVNRSSFDGDNSDWNGANLERGWYNFRLSNAQNAYGWQPTEYDFNIKVGRQYVEFGTGLALSLPLDAITASIYYRDWTITGLGAMSIPSTYNADISVVGNTKESRRFWGIELRYEGINNHHPFAYFLSQEDQDFDRTVAWTVNGNQVSQVYGYNSRYVGLGSQGRFFHRDLQYTCEAVAEFGKSHAWANGTNEVQNINAWAVDSEIRYVIPDQRNSQLSVEYVLASGDNDRIFSPTNTLGGNKANSPDQSYMGWGYRNTGLVLAPRLSNLGAVRLGFSSYAFNEYKLFEDLQLGADFFMFHKQQAGGAASDSLSTNSNHFLGTEFDIYADWRITSDLGLMLRYGMFFPGKAFPDETHRQLLFTGLTLNF